MNKERFELSIDHPMLAPAKQALDRCLNRMVSRAVGTGSMEGTATLKIGMEIVDVLDEISGEIRKEPQIKFKVGYAVPIKESADGKIVERSSLQQDPESGWLLVNGQVSIEELLDDQEDG